MPIHDTLQSSFQLKNHAASCEEKANNMMLSTKRYYYTLNEMTVFHPIERKHLYCRSLCYLIPCSAKVQMMKNR
jgi:hypothetical protein